LAFADQNMGLHVDAIGNDLHPPLSKIAQDLRYLEMRVDAITAILRLGM
jgi:hypothetical protein